MASLSSTNFTVGSYLIDSGSIVSIVPAEQATDVDPDTSSLPRVVAANNTAITLLGTCEIKPIILGKEYRHRALVSPDVKLAILGCDFFEKTATDILVDIGRRELLLRSATQAPEMVAQILEPSVQAVKPVENTVLDAYPELTFPSLGAVESLTLPLNIDTGENRPIFQKVRPLHGQKKSEIEREIRKWVDEGVIVPMVDEVTWASPIHAVKKSNGSWRVCGDFRLLNSATKPDSYPLPDLSFFNERMAGCKIFSKLDLRRPYHQIPVSPNDQHKTVINTTAGLFKFKRVPFGLRNASAIFQRNIDTILRGQEDHAFAYLDDVLIFSNTPEEHEDHLRQVLSSLAQHCILLNKDKCQFLQERLGFLGHVISSDGLSVSDERIVSIQDYPLPKNLKELERFLGMLAYIHKFIPHASELTAELHAMRKFKNSKEFLEAWTDRHSQVFSNVKRAIADVSILVHLKPGASLELWTDASADGVGAALMQQEGDDFKPIAYWSKSFNKAQKNYAAFDRELLAISYAIKHFQSYVEGQNVTVRTDHRPIVQAFKKLGSTSTPLQSRHFSYISQFVEEICYREGAKNEIADALSRVNGQEELADDNFTSVPLFATFDAVSTAAVTPRMPLVSEIANAQTIDRDLLAWVEKHGSSTSKFRPFLADIQGHRIWVIASKAGCRILVPTVLQKLVFEASHGLIHSGVKASVKALRKDFYWPNMTKEISGWVRSCVSCRRNKSCWETKSIFHSYLLPLGVLLRFMLTVLDHFLLVPKETRHYSQS